MKRWMGSFKLVTGTGGACENMMSRSIPPKNLLQRVEGQAAELAAFDQVWAVLHDGLQLQVQVPPLCQRALAERRGIQVQYTRRKGSVNIELEMHCIFRTWVTRS